ncbi:MAG: hypothetical protein ABIL20_08550, partial [candidate division WOR-3 bacterium]
IHQTMKREKRERLNRPDKPGCSGPDPCGVEGVVIGLGLRCWFIKTHFQNPAARRVLQKKSCHSGTGVGVFIVKCSL